MFSNQEGNSWRKNRNSGVGRHRNSSDRGRFKRGSSNEDNADGSGMGRHPPGLSGREIGMWYRKRSLEKNKGKKAVREIKPIFVHVNEKAEAEIRSSLDNVKAKSSFRYAKKCSSVASTSKAVVKSEDDIKEEKCEYTSKQIVTVEQNITEKYSHLEESRFKKLFLKNITGSITEILSNYTKLELKDDQDLNRAYKDELMEKYASTRYEKMMEFRLKLPSYTKREEIIDLVEKNSVLVISGETGCGKTTQVAQFILDNEIMMGRGSTCRIICTQPRRISAISVAERVADERDETVGSGSVGYQIRLERKLPRSKGSILYCTTGILLQYMQSDPALRTTSHVIIDEIHERDTLSDFVITILKDVLEKRSDLKVILMSATLNAEKFSRFFGNCPMLKIDGFTFPVTEYYLEDILELIKIDPRYLKKSFGNKKDTVYKDYIEPYVRDLRGKGKYSQTTLNLLLNPAIEECETIIIFELLCHICHTTNAPGAVLVFLPGWDRIAALNKLLTESGRFPSSSYVIIPLHSLMPTTTQRSVFKRPPPGVRKIVIATNIAETSITIDDIVFVIDSGKIKMKNFDVQNNIATLKPEWVSLANARQRRGRAGRVQEGVCFHLFSKARQMSLQDYTLPEMLRTRLEEVILQTKILQLGYCKPFLQKVLDPPSPEAVDLSLKILTSINALDEEENLTPLGYHLGKLPLDPQTGKMILMAALFKCVDPIFTVAASLTFKDAFIIPLGKEDEVSRVKDSFDLGRKSDHLMVVEMFNQWERAEENGWGQSFCRKHFVVRNVLFQLRDMKTQFTMHLYDMNFLKSNDHKADDCNINSSNLGLLRAIICSGLYPNVAIVSRVKFQRRLGKNVVILRTPEHGRVSLHPKSVNSRALSFESNFLVYYEMLKSTCINIHDSTMVHSLPLIFFGGSLNMYDQDDKRVFEFPSGIKFSLTSSTASLITELRIRLDWLLEDKVSNPGVTDWRENSDEGRILCAILQLITGEDRSLMGDNDYEYDSDDDDDF